MGLISYYRKFVPNCAAITAPLTDLTKRGSPNKIEWNENVRKGSDNREAATRDFADPSVARFFEAVCP